MNRITLPGEPPAIQECTLCDNNHDCWGCSKFEEIVRRLWELENKFEPSEDFSYWNQFEKLKPEANHWIDISDGTNIKSGWFDGTGRMLIDTTPIQDWFAYYGTTPVYWRYQY